MASIEAPISSLSGGNQQKADARALAGERRQDLHAEFADRRRRHRRQGRDLRARSARSPRRARRSSSPRPRSRSSRAFAIACSSFAKGASSANCSGKRRRNRIFSIWPPEAAMSASACARTASDRLALRRRRAGSPATAPWFRSLRCWSSSRWRGRTCFPTVDNLLNIMNQISILGTMAFGLTVCLVMGLFDLSIAAMATLGGYVATFLLVHVSRYDRRSRRRASSRSSSAAADRGRQRPDRQLSRHLGVYRHACDRLDHHRRDARTSRTRRRSSPASPTRSWRSDRARFSAFQIRSSSCWWSASCFGSCSSIPSSGRHLYAIGGNAEASRLSGIAVKRYAPFALAVCAACAGTRRADGGRGSRRRAAARRRRHLSPQRLRGRLHRRLVVAARESSTFSAPSSAYC